MQGPEAETDRHLASAQAHSGSTTAPPSSALHLLIERQAQRSPDAIAVEAGTKSWSYAELNRDADKLAGYLRSLGVGTEQFVGVLMTRSVEQIIASLAVLKAGGAYAPLPSADPWSRLHGMLIDLEANVLLVDDSSLDNADLGRYQVIDVPAFVASHSRSSPDMEVTARSEAVNFANSDQACVVLFTSGSTGKPKGVVLTHRNVTGLVTDAVWSGCDFSRVLMQSANTFDLSTLEMWMPLANGVTIVVAPSGKLEPREIARVIRTHDVTGAFFTTGLFNVMVAEELESLKGLRALWSGGERASGPLIAEALKGLPDTKIVNGYGPTEATTFTTFHQIVEPPPRDMEVPVGIPLRDKTVYILDGLLSPSDESEAGEIFIAGSGIARGYLKRPGQTAASFIPDPLGAPGSRMYRTGDMASRSSTDPIKFIGRADDLVKIRGFRIELGEISAALRDCDGVADVALRVREDTPGHRMIAAYVVLQETCESTGLNIRKDAAKRLPEYMVPSAVIIVDALPLTPHGKVDIRALAAPSVDDLAVEYEPPRTTTELVVVEVFENLLNMRPIGLAGSFFDMGGDSLLAMRAVAQLRSRLAIDLSMSAMFEGSTVRQVAAACATAGIASEPIVRLERGAPLGLSSGQKRLWFLEQLEPESAEYVIPYALRLRGELDDAALERAFGSIIARHEVLRTRIVAAHGEPKQLVERHSEVSVMKTDLRDGGSLEWRLERATELAVDLARTPIDMRFAPMMTLQLVRLQEQDYVLMLAIHHLAADAWSIAILASELAQFYSEEVSSTPVTLAPLDIHYADFAAWQLGVESSGAIDKGLDFWESELGNLSPLRLPSDFPRPAQRSTAGGTMHFALSAVQVSNLKDLGRDENATLYMTLLSAFHIFLAGYSGDERIVTGSPVANRPRPELEHLIGFFANTVAFQSRIDPADSFFDVLHQIRNKTVAGIDYQEVPFDRVVERINPKRDPSRHPVFQVMFVLDNAPDPHWSLSAMDIESFPIDEASARFDLTFYAEPNNGGLTCRFVYSKALFESSSVSRMAKNFVQLIDSIGEFPHLPIGQLELVAEPERAVIRGWESPKQIGQWLMTYEYVAVQARETPAAIAVVCGQDSITYAELVERADRLACEIIACGVEVEDRVATLLPQGINQVIGMLGILKAGAVYVPLSMQQPKERLVAISADAGLSLLVTDSSLEAGTVMFASRTISMDRIPASGALPTPPRIHADNVAYLIYTSGSSGKPKGVLGTHRGLSNYVAANREIYGLEPGDSVLQLASSGYDASLRDMLLPLASGATLVFLHPSVAKSPESVAAAISACDVTAILSVVPSMLREYGSYPGFRIFDSLKLIVSSGESMRSAGEWKAKTSTTRVLNQYGPTECAMTTTVGLGHPVAPGGSDLVGYPIAGTQVLVLDKGMRRCAIGVVGELFIAGAGVARGYANASRATAESFLPNPFAVEPGTVMYKTGDRAKWTQNGELCLLGRSDRQIKIRGNRVELGELESVIESHRSVARCAVKLSEGPDPVVLAFIEAESTGGDGLDVRTIRAFLADRLPEYMLPASFLYMSSLPTTISGKIDRQSLPSLKPRSTSASEYIAPSTAAEVQIAAIWCDLLNIDRVGVHEDFFEVGGHSLLAVRAVSRLRSTFSVGIGVLEFLSNPTIAALARLMASAHASRIAALFSSSETGSRAD
ncbi:non-ribosomal peptide synthetase [Glaciibacter superstes]|uniref:non-ribosomal peptide synthetase n=1 Tax=Glaciibacter superstes TaxID=501023 RepID=UPI0003B3994E|nr:non-ribosomal peptide synthetase [Glaciibacter superstes]